MKFHRRQFNACKRLHPTALTIQQQSKRLILAVYFCGKDSDGSSSPRAIGGGDRRLIGIDVTNG
jgi:hypothetical protein